MASKYGSVLVCQFDSQKQSLHFPGVLHFCHIFTTIILYKIAYIHYIIFRDHLKTLKSIKFLLKVNKIENLKFTMDMSKLYSCEEVDIPLPQATISFKICDLNTKVMIPRGPYFDQFHISWYTSVSHYQLVHLYQNFFNLRSLFYFRNVFITKNIHKRELFLQKHLRIT